MEGIEAYESHDQAHIGLSELTIQRRMARRQTIETTLANLHAPNRNQLHKEFPTLVDQSNPVWHRCIETTHNKLLLTVTHELFNSACLLC